MSRLQAQSFDAAVYDAIRERIASGDLRPGDPLVEAQLSEEFGISKTPVREALISLGRDGLVNQRPYHVTRVARPTHADIRQVLELRAWLEGEIAAEIATGEASDEDEELFDALRVSISAARRALKSGQHKKYARAIEQFSELQIAHSGNRFAIELLGRLRHILALLASVAQSSPGRRERSIEEHDAIFQALLDRDPDAARAATRAHLKSIESDSLRAVTEMEEASAG